VLCGASATFLDAKTNFINPLVSEILWPGLNYLI